ncbi:hypothetical protein [Roseimaritima sediminicola]|uniref:hypothetical protein n=1 Tax=Roseimaritima sediminicola TaxID=2662066 RepID=UPI0012983BEE|nr:hypothetical protein [Roseimaritima sediminicola]
MTEPVPDESNDLQPVRAKLVRPAAGDSAPPAEDAAARAGSKPGLYEAVVHSRVAILATLFCVTGFLGLHLLWLNPNFTRLQRWFWATIVTIYTCALIALVAWVVMWSWGNVSRSL